MIRVGVQTPAVCNAAVIPLKYASLIRNPNQLTLLLLLLLRQHYNASEANNPRLCPFGPISGRATASLEEQTCF